MTCCKFALFSYHKNHIKIHPILAYFIQCLETFQNILVTTLVQGLLDEKTSNNESHQEQYLKYIAECERLSKELAQASSEKDNALAQTKAKIQETQDLRKEVSSIIEKKKRVEGEVERLRAHLVQVEEGYTVELMESEDRERELRKKVAQLEDKLRVMTHTSSEVSENASQAEMLTGFIIVTYGLIWWENYVHLIHYFQLQMVTD